MNNLPYQRIISSITYQKLIFLHRRVSVSLTLIMLICYYCFMVMVAIFPKLVGLPIINGSALTWGVVAGISIILIAFILTGYYTWFANRTLEPLKLSLVQELKK